MDPIRQVGARILGVAAAGLWRDIGAYLILRLARATVGLRVSEDREREGRDLSRHGERAYNQ